MKRPSVHERGFANVLSFNIFDLPHHDGFLMTVSKVHFLDVANGEFHGTSADDLQNLFKEVEKGKSRDHLVVHFHGGLVSRNSAESTAETLLPDYIESGAYPIFFFWNSGALQVLATNLHEVAKEPVFQRLLRRLAQLLVGKLTDPTGMRGPQIEIESIKDIPVEPEALLEWTRKHEPLPNTEIHELTNSQRQQIQRELILDTVLSAESRAIAATLREPAEIEWDLMTHSRGAPSVRASRRTLMSPSVLKRICEEVPNPGTRSAATLLAIANYGVEIAASVVGRYRRGHDHGLFATIAEEIARSLYADSIGSTVWALMKRDTEDAFGNDPHRHAGTAFIANLLKWWKPGRRITLIGHSTGAIYIGHLLVHADRVLPSEAKFDVVLLAPACTYEFVHERISVFTNRISGFNMFALRDELERGYWEVPLLYPASLLYMVSGLFEDPIIDMPILGMQRYFHAAGSYDQLPIRAVVEWVNKRCVWAVSDAGSILWTGANKHGGFLEDSETRRSLKHILLNGFK